MTTDGTAVPAAEPASPADRASSTGSTTQSVAEDRATAEQAGPAKKTIKKTTTIKKTSAAKKATATTKAAAKKAAAATKATAQKAQKAQKATAAKKAAAKKTTAKKTSSAKAAELAGADSVEMPAATGTPSESTGVGTAYPVGAPNGIVPADRAASGRTPGAPQPSTVRQIVDHPGYAPELLALAAVRGLGPQARAWAAWVRAAYPGATTEGLVRLATRRYVRLAAAGGALSTATGMLAPLAELAAVTWTQANLVLHLAAAYGHDPTLPERAADLLVLTRVHPDVVSARAALAAAEEAITGRRDNLGPATDGGATKDVDGESGRLAEAGWRLGAPIVAQTANWLALRLALRRLPGAMVLGAATLSSANTERLAARAVEYYRSEAGWPKPVGRPAVTVEGGSR